MAGIYGFLPLDGRYISSFFVPSPLSTKRLSAKEDYSPELFSSRLVKPMVAHLAGRLRLDGGRGPVYPTAALVLKVREKSPKSPEILKS